jgi:hypothetical protein
MNRRVTLALLALAPLSARAEFRLERTLKLDPGGRFALDTEMGSVTVTGTVHGSMSRGKLQGILGSGGELLRLRTSGGGVRIHGL